MRAFAAFARLLWRPFALWNLFLCGSLSFVGWMAASFARGLAAGDEAPGLAAVRESELFLALWSVLAPLALGTWLGWSLYDLLVSSFVAHLPALRRRLYAFLLGAGVACAVLTAWWCDEQPGAQSGPLFAAQAFLWFALGVFWGDPLHARSGAWALPLQLVALLPVLLAPELVAAFERAPALLGPLAVAAGVVLLALPLRRSAVRERAGAEDLARLHAAGDPLRSSGHQLSLGSKSRVRWDPERKLSGVGDWTRATLHAGFGHARGGWVGALVSMGLVWSVVLVVLRAAHRVVLDESPLEASLDALGAPWYGVVIALPVWAAMFLVLSPFTLSTPGATPLGRAARAEVAWRASARIACGMVLSFAAFLWAFGELLFRLGVALDAAVGVAAERPEGLPSWLHVLGAIAVAAPIAQAARLRWIEGRDDGRPTFLAVLGLACLLLSLPAAGASVLLAWLLGRAPLVAWCVVVGLLLLASQTAWRAYLVRWHATRDLAS